MSLPTQYTLPTPLPTTQDALLQIERDARLAGDAIANGTVLVAIIQNAGLQKVNEMVALLAKKRGGLKMAIAKMVDEAMLYINKAQSKEEKLRLIDTIRTVTEGKIYVEIQRARVTRILSKMKEDEGNVIEACDILQELQVETFGSMERPEKTDFFLEQMRLTLAKEDFVRTLIISRKINTKFFKEEGTSELKLRFYELMVQHALHENNYLDICRYFREVFDTKCIKEDDSKWPDILRNIVSFAILSPYSNEQNEMIYAISKEPKLDKLPLYLELIKGFTKSELMRWPKIEEVFKTELGKIFVFDNTPQGAKRWSDFRERVIEFNIRVIAKHYRCIRTEKLNVLLNLHADEAESFVSKLVTGGIIFAKINRPRGIIQFKRKEVGNQVLESWNTSVDSLLQNIVKATHLIAKEELEHKIIQASA